MDWAFGHEVFADDGEAFLIGSVMVAVGPVAAVDDAIFAKGIEQFVEARLVEGHILGYLVVNFAEHAGEFGIDAGAFGEFAEIGVALFVHGGIGGGVEAGQMIDDHAQIGDAIFELEEIGDELLGGVGGGRV